MEQIFLLLGFFSAVTIFSDLVTFSIHPKTFKIFIPMVTPNIQLIKAIFEDDDLKINSLLEEGSVNANDCSFFNLPPLLRAALYGKPKALKALIQHGADKNLMDRQGHTALQLAKKHNHPEIVEILLQN